jgi:hypothetical protein
LNDGFDFEGANARLIPLLPSGTRVAHVKRAQLGDQAARDALIDSLHHTHVFASRDLLIDDAVRRAKLKAYDDVRRTWLLFADPTMRMK